MLTEGVEVGQQNDNWVGWITKNFRSEWKISIFVWDLSEENIIPDFDNIGQSLFKSIAVFFES